MVLQQWTPFNHTLLPLHMTSINHTLMISITQENMVQYSSQEMQCQGMHTVVCIEKDQLKYMESPNDYREEDQLQHMD